MAVDTVHPQLAWAENLNRVRYDPPGNYISKRLRNLGLDCSSVFGQSVASSSGLRWSSITRSDFKEVDFKARLPRTAGYCVTPSSPLNLGYHAGEERAFMNWRVPSRVTESHTSREVSPRGKQSARNSRMEVKSARDNIEMLPDINSGRQEVDMIHSAGGQTFTSAKSSQSIPVKSPRKTRQMMKNEILQSYSTHDIPTSEEHWFKGGEQQNQKVIESAGRTKNGTKGVLQTWIKKASPRDRRIALAVFESAVGKEMLSKIAHEDQINEVIEDVKRGRKIATLRLQDNEEVYDEGRLRYLRLLTPNTRNNSWMYQTWHHLPPNPDTNPVNNTSSMYTTPHKYQHRHFNIHPDWGS